MLTLVIGGAASGKSAYAEHLAVQSGGPRYYLATMQVWDAECAARVAKHRAMRAQKQFATVECPQNLHLVRLPQQGTALLEDLGNLAANELYRPDGSCLPPKQAAEKMLAGIEAIAAQCNHLIIVSNEVFSGGADYAGETDLYLQALAMVNNALPPKPMPSAAWCAACRCTTKEGNAHDSFADDRRGICHVLGCAGAAV